MAVSEKDYPVKVGTFLFTMVEPHEGSEVAYNRWYEHDHFYSGCLMGPNVFAGDRFVAACDVGQHQMWAAQHCRFARPECHLTSGGLGAMGFGLPAGSAVEQAAVDTIWARNPGPKTALTERYGHQTQLLGRLFREGQGWTADWVLTRGDSELSRWSFSDPSAQRALASGADGAADAIARRDARRAEVGEPGVHQVLITGLRVADDFTRAMGYLQTLPVVRELAVEEATPDSLRLRLDLAVGVPAFDGFLAAGDVLEAEGPAYVATPGMVPPAEPAVARYRLRP